MVFKIDGEEWTLDLSEGTNGKLYKGAPEGGEKPDLTLTMSDHNFTQLVMGKLNPQQVGVADEIHHNPEPHIEQ